MVFINSFLSQEFFYLNRILLKDSIKIRIALYAIFFVLTNPGTLLADPERGKILFTEKRCVLCHNITASGTEFKPVCPGLRGVKNRHSQEWLFEWLADPAGTWKKNGVQVRDINRRYFAYRGSKPRPRKSFMATVIGKTVHLSFTEIEDLIDYLMTL